MSENLSQATAGSAMPDMQLANFLSCAASERRLIILGTMELQAYGTASEVMDEYTAVQGGQPIYDYKSSEIGRVFTRRFIPYGMANHARTTGSKKLYELTDDGEYIKVLAGHLLTLVEPPEHPSLRGLIGTPNTCEGLPSSLVRLRFVKTILARSQVPPLHELARLCGVNDYSADNHLKQMDAAGLAARQFIKSPGAKLCYRMTDSIEDFDTVDTDKSLTQRLVTVLNTNMQPDSPASYTMIRDWLDVMDGENKLPVHNGSRDRVVRILRALERAGWLKRESHRSDVVPATLTTEQRGLLRQFVDIVNAFQQGKKRFIDEGYEKFDGIMRSPERVGALIMQDLKPSQKQTRP